MREWARKRLESDLPLKLLFSLAANLVGVSASANAVFSFVGFMIEDFGLVTEHRDAGKYAGYIAGAFFVAEAMGSLLWGWVADRWGRRRALLICTGGGVVTTVLFGMTGHLSTAVLARFTGGLFSGNFVIAKSVVNDICTMSNRSSAFSTISFAWGGGAILGSFLGGLLARPAVKNPDLFAKGSFFEVYPYALQGLVIGFLQVIAFWVTFRFVPETKEVTGAPVEVALPELNEKDTSEEPLMEHDVLEDVFQASEASDPVAGPKVPKVFLDADKIDKKERRTLTIKMIFLYCFLSLATSIRDETLPLYLMTDVVDKGLGWNTSEIGVFLGLLGAFMLVAQILYVPFARAKGAHFVFMVGVSIYILSLTMIPMVTWVAANHRALLWPIAILLGFMTTIGASMSFTSSNCLVNAAAGKSLAGRVNGIAGASASLTRAVGPFIAAPLFAWSANTKGHFPADTSITFLITAVLLVMLLAFTCNIPKNLA